MALMIVLLVLFFVFLGMSIFMQLYQNKLLNNIDDVPIIITTVEASKTEIEELI